MPSRGVALLTGAGGVLLAGAGCATKPPALSRADLLSEVRASEEAFAATMARRDAAAFGRFIAEDAVFVNGGNPLRGRAAIVEHWRRFFVTPEAPFAWRPELVEVAAGGTLGYTEGPVSTPAGVKIATFFTTWQRSAGGTWLVVFDNGYAVCKA